jgi:hypothetical protein
MLFLITPHLVCRRRRVAYYINDKWAVYLEGTYWGYSFGGTIGVRYTF